MQRPAILACLFAAGFALQASTAAAQTPARNPNLPDSCTSKEVDAKDDFSRFIGDVICTLPDGTKVYGDIVNLYEEGDARRIVAEGNVVFDGAAGYISATRMHYNTQTGTGTFDDAKGLLSLGPDADRTQFAGQDPEVAFEGDRLEKIGPRRYRLTRGRWTTCTQPTPRWDFTTKTMELELNRHVIARNTIFRVKDVPVFWLPWFYFPLEEDNRSTGFLMPSIGNSTFRGQAISNAFFWAIDRSQDATFFHDWFTRAGQGAGVEYRYVASPQSSGTIKLYRFARSETTFTENGTTTTLAGSNSFELSGGLVQVLGPGIIGRARMDYFSDVVSQQLLYQNIHDASRRNRLLEGGVTATRGPWSFNGLYQRNEVINGVDDVLVTGSTPRLQATLAPQRLFASPIYGSMTTEYAFLPARRVRAGVVADDDSFGRFDASPTVRVPLSKLSFLSINTSATYRATYYSSSADEASSEIVVDSFLRQYATSRTEVIGPVLSRIFTLEEGSFAERVKHVIEPTVTLDLTSPIRGFRRTPLQTDVSDFVIGGTSQVTYGVTNRLFLRRPSVNKVRGETREFVTIGLQQTAYSNGEASRYDTSYSSAIGVGPGRTLSPVALTARVSPSNTFDGNMRVEYDVDNGLQTLTTGAGINYGNGGITLNYSRQQFDRTLPANSFVNASTRAQFFENRVNGTYSLSWDIARGYVVSQGIVGSYMAQCCGVQAEYQQYNYPSGFGLPISVDRRINFSFMLAGLGTFSNFFGAFGGN
jgi:LPS-assembly protein